MPIQEALARYRRDRIVSFDVPGHKQGRGNPALTEFLGEQCISVDVNSMKPLDNLSHPVSVIKEAEELAAEAFGAKAAFFMVNGTSSSVQAMIMASCKKGDKIIIPRNIHRSAINALVVGGAVPVYVNPGLDLQLGIPLAMSAQDVAAAIKANPDAKAVFINNPTYYGVCSDITEISRLAHEAGMLLLADEAHGTHLYFGENLPQNSMSAGADMAAVSLHKTGGSLTQSSVLLVGENVNPDYVRQIINLTQTTSASYLLLSSLDISRRELALRGGEIFERVIGYAAYAREEINKIGGYIAFAEERTNGRDFYAFDTTKLSIHTRTIGLAGVEVYDLLRDEYDIQIEFGDIGNILAIISVGDRMLDIERLIAALTEIKRRYAKDPAGMFENEYISPEVVLSPQKAFYMESIDCPINQSEGQICAEFLMCYPPGIPILAPGERIKKDALAYIKYAKEKGCFLTGPQDLSIENIRIVKQ